MGGTKNEPLTVDDAKARLRAAAAAVDLSPSALLRELAHRTVSRHPTTAVTSLFIAGFVLGSSSELRRLFTRALIEGITNERVLENALSAILSSLKEHPSK
jgi:hypothetical protein